MGYVLESGTIGGNVLLKDNTAGTTKLVVPFGAANGVIVSPPMGNGILKSSLLDFKKKEKVDNTSRF
jgi:hypothetical protein